MTLLPKKENRFSNLEGLRGIACIMVVFYHCGANLHTPPFALFGFTGVHLFFVLSGFLLYRGFLPAMAGQRDYPSTSAFLLRRALRIYPPYIASVAIFVALRYLTGQQPPSAWEILARVTLVFNYFPHINFYGINSVYWSLAIEAQFYVVLPLLCRASGRLFSNRSTWLLPIVMIVIGIVFRLAERLLLNDLYMRNVDTVAFRSVFSYFDLFAFGMLAATGEKAGWAKRCTSWPAVGFGFACFVVANNWCLVATSGRWQSGSMPLPFVTFFPVVLCGGLAILLLGAAGPPTRHFSWLGSFPLRMFGKISYSVYLYHVGVQFFLFKVSPFTNLPYGWMALIHAGISIVLCGGVAAVMYWIVERPSLQPLEHLRGSSDERGLEPVATRSKALPLAANVPP